MRHVSSMTAIAALLVASSVGAADARQAKSYVHATACGGHVMGSEAGDASGNCVSAATTRKRVRSARSNDVRRAHVSRAHASCGGRLSTVRAASGAIACVTASTAAKFQGFVTELEATGYRIDFMGGWRAHGSCRGCNMHPRGLAIDINQTGRNRVTRRFPPGVTAMAERHGLLHGAVWQNADAGHFELMSASPTRYAYAHLSASPTRTARRSMHAYASAVSVPGAVDLAGKLSAQGTGSH
jgi:hypothetical protein